MNIGYWWSCIYHVTLQGAEVAGTACGWGWWVCAANTEDGMFDYACRPYCDSELKSFNSFELCSTLLEYYKFMIQGYCTYFIYTLNYQEASNAWTLITQEECVTNTLSLLVLVGVANWLSTLGSLSSRP